jgi:hypothetical protein
MVAASTGFKRHDALLRSQDMHVDRPHLRGPDEETTPAGTEGCCPERHLAVHG